MRLIPLCAAALLSACSLLPADEPGDSAPTSLVVTDRAKYDARLVMSGLDRVVFEIPFEIRNTTDGPLYRVGCHRPPGPVLEKSVGGEWVTAYATGELSCLSPPFVIAAGEISRDTLRVDGHLPGQNASPTFDTEIEGMYRLNLGLYMSLTDEPVPLGKNLVPLGERVSNTFEVE